MFARVLTIFRYRLLADQTRTILPIVDYLLAKAASVAPPVWKHAGVISVWPQAYFHSFAKRFVYAYLQTSYCLLKHPLFTLTFEYSAPTTVMEPRGSREPILLTIEGVEPTPPRPSLSRDSSNIRLKSTVELHN